MTEQWKPITGYEGYYEVSNQGRVRSVERVIMRSNGIPQRINERIMSPGLRRDHPGVNLHKDGKFKAHYVHTLVLTAFVGPRPPGHEGCHNDGNPANNRVENLRWDTPLGNANDKRLHGTHNNTKKTHCKRGHPLEAPNLIACRAKHGRRVCLACHRANCRVRYHKELAPQAKQIADSYYQQIINQTEKIGA